MTNYSSVEKRTIKTVQRLGVQKWSVGTSGVTSIEIIDLENKVFLINHADGESILVYNVDIVVFGG